MQSYTRHQLKQDKFAVATKEAVHWSVEHRTPLVWGTFTIIVLLIAAGGGYQYIQAQDSKASLALNEGITTLNAPLRAPDQPVNPNLKTFTSATERADAAMKQFLQVAKDYSYTSNGKYARYLAGVAAIEKGDAAQGESLLREAAGSSKPVAAIAKLSLASLYRSQGKEADAAREYREVIAMNNSAAPRETAQIELADMYEQNKKPAEAIKVYQEIVKQQEAYKKDAKNADPSQKSAFEKLATDKIEELKKKP